MIMRYFRSSMIVLLVVVICSACQTVQSEEPKESISLSDLNNLSQEAATLHWDDFEEYLFEDIGSGIYIRKYNVEGGHQLLVTGKSLESPPEKIYVVDQQGKEMDFTPDTLSQLNESK